MARYLGPKHRLCRQFGEKLCDSPKCPVIRRPYRPGQHGPKGSPRLSEYGTQFREKQKAAKLYRVLERQFRNYYKKAISSKGDTGANLIRLLESRLDNVVYRLGFAPTRDAARQAVSHGHVQVDGSKVDIPSYQVRVNETISIAPKSIGKRVFVEAAKAINQKTIPGWLAVTNEQQLAGKVVGQPGADEIKTVFDPALVIEFYSR